MIIKEGKYFILDFLDPKDFFRLTKNLDQKKTI